jgi:hypothetical protein
MGFLKNLAIKKVTKKRFYQLIGLIECDPRIESKTFDPIETLRDFIKAINLSGGNIEEPPGITNWKDLFAYLLFITVKAELDYDQTMGSEDDFNLIIDTADKEFQKFKRESTFKKFIRREMMDRKADNFLKRGKLR